MNKKPILICIMGIDGVGKTTHANLIHKHLQSQGIKCEYKWLRFHYLLSLPLLAFCRLAGYTKVYKFDAQKSSYHEFYRSKLISTLYPWVLLLDTVLFTAVKVYIPMFLGISIVCDRFVYDTLIDAMVSTNNIEMHKKKVGKLFFKLIPDTAKFVMLTLDKSIILSRRDELKHDLAFDNRYRIYNNLSHEFNIRVVDNIGTVEEINKLLISSLEI